ncbi:MAG: BMC domain-containing protein [Deltaproteobacteria bacterium]|nr:BMC domain-containing protein [Deltaproteobacteria bacterium]
MKFSESAISVLEFTSITRGLFVVDVVAKKADVKVLLAEPVSHGKFILLFTGGVGEVEESYAAALDASGDFLVENILIAQVTRELGPAIGGESSAPFANHAVGMLESTSIAAAVEAADRVMKTAPLNLNRFRMGKGIGGKSYFIFSGMLEDVQAGIEVGVEQLESYGALIGSELIARPNAEFLEVV